MTRPIILLVEDEPDDQFFFLRAVQKARLGWDVRVLTDGHELQSYLEGFGIYADRENFPLPVLIFLDLHLPRISGEQVLRWLQTQERFKHIPVIAMTSSLSCAELENAVGLGATRCLHKSVDLQDLGSVVESLPDCQGA